MVAFLIVGLLVYAAYTLGYGKGYYSGWDEHNERLVKLEREIDSLIDEIVKRDNEGEDWKNQ